MRHFSAIILVGIFFTFSVFFLLKKTELPTEERTNNADSQLLIEQKITKTKSNSIKCESNVKWINDSKDFTKAEVAQLKQYFYTLSQKGISWSQLDLLAEKSEIPPWIVSRVLPVKPENTELITPIDLYENFQLAPFEETDKVKGIINTNQINSIAVMMGEKVVFYLYGGMPIFSYVLLNTEHASLVLIDSLLSQNLIPRLADIINVFNTIEDNAITLSLIENSNQLKNVYWQESDGFKSFSLLAAQKFNHEVLSAWLSQTDNAVNDITLMNELDLLPSPDKKQYSDALKTVEILLDNGRQIQTRLGYRKLSSWLPASWLLANEYRFFAPKISLEYTTKLHLAELSSMVTTFSANKKNNGNCSPQLNVDEQDAYADNAELTYIKKQAYVDQAIKNIKFENTFGSLLNLTISNDLNAKKQLLIRYLLDKNWLDALEIIPLFINSPHEELILKVALAEGLAGNAPQYFISALFNWGAVLPKDAIRIMAVLDYKELATRLMPYGLDIHYVNSLGMNALSHIILSSNDILGEAKMFKFLLDEGVSLKPTTAGLDPLNYALKKVTESKVAISYAKGLIEYGAEVDNSHIQQMNAIKLNNIEVYQEVIYLLPELAE